MLYRKDFTFMSSGQVQKITFTDKFVGQNDMFEVT